MRPWTTRTVKATLVAAGLAALSTTTATAETPATPMPDLSQVPDEIGAGAPLDVCEAQHELVDTRGEVPCVNANVKASSPNVVKKVGADIADSIYGATDDSQGERSLLTRDAPNRIAGQIVAETSRAQELTKVRPTVDAEAEPRNLSLIDDDGKLLDAKVSPRGEHHQGFSAANTAVDLDAAEGVDTGRARSDSPFGEGAGPAVRDSALRIKDATSHLPDKTRPALRNVGAKTVDAVRPVRDTLHDAATGAPQVSVGRSGLPNINQPGGLVDTKF